MYPIVQIWFGSVSMRHVWPNLEGYGHRNNNSNMANDFLPVVISVVHFSNPRAQVGTCLEPNDPSTQLWFRKLQNPSQIWVREIDSVPNSQALCLRHINQFAAQKHVYEVQQAVFEKLADSFKLAWFTLPEYFKGIWNPWQKVLIFFGFLFTPADFWNRVANTKHRLQLGLQ